MFLESHLGLSELVDRVREASTSAGELKKEIIKKNKETLLTSSLEDLSTSTASRIVKESSWLKLYDMDMVWGHTGTMALKCLYKDITRPSGTQHPNVYYLTNLHFLTANCTLGS